MADYRACLISFTRPDVLGLSAVTGIADGLGAFTPKFIWLWTTQQAVDGFTSMGHMTQCWFQAPVGSAARGWSSTKGNNSILFRAAMNTIRSFFSFWDSLSQTNNIAFLDSVSSGQFVLNWTQVDLAVGRSPCQIFGLVLGGADFSAAIGQQIVTTTGSKVITGIGFPPKGLLMSAVATVRDIQTYAPGVSIDNLPVLGWTDGTNQAASCGGGEAGTVARRQRVDRCAMMYNPLGVDLRAEANFISFDSDGFTTNWSDVAAFPQDPYGDPGYYYSAFGGALPCACGVITQPPSPGVQSVVLSGRPSAVLFMSHNSPSGTSPINGGTLFSFGAVDALGNQFSSWYGVLASGGNNTATRGMFSTRAITTATPVLPPSAPTTTLTGAATATITATGFDVDFTTVDGVAREILWFAFGVAAGMPPPTFPCPPDPLPVLGTPGCSTQLTPWCGGADAVGCRPPYF